MFGMPQHRLQSSFSYNMLHSKEIVCQTLFPSRNLGSTVKFSRVVSECRKVHTENENTREPQFLKKMQK